MKLDDLWGDILHNDGVAHLQERLEMRICLLARQTTFKLLAPYVPNLTYLSLNRVRSANTLVLYEGCFPHLKTLVLKRMPDVSELNISDRALPQIEGLYVVTLPKLNKVPQGIESLRSLKKLWLLHLHQDFKVQWHMNGMQEKMQYVLELHI